MIRFISANHRNSKRKRSARSRSVPNWALAKLEDRVLLAGDVAVAVQAADAVAMSQHESSQTESQNLATSQLSTQPIASQQIVARTIVVIDYRVDDIESLTAGMDDAAELIVIDQDNDAIDSIGKLLRSNPGTVDALHIVCHGHDGALQIGNSTIDQQTLLDQASKVKQWANRLTSDADILLYGCDVVSTDKGMQFIELMSNLTGADVAASSNRTGADTIRSTNTTADWVLEHTTGQVEAALAFDPATRRSYQHTLNIVINAWGQQGGEQFDLQIDGETVQTYTADTTWTPFVYETDAEVSADQIRIVFKNDDYDPNTGFDRNLFVNNIQVNGENFETDSDSTFSTGSWLPEDGVTPGFGRGIVLHSNGYFQYGASTPELATGTEITVRASGQTGNEWFQVNAGDAGTLGEFQAGTTSQDFVVTTSADLSLEDITVEFTNDLFDPASDYDRNLTVLSVTVTDIASGESETGIPGSSNVFSTGTYLAEDGVVPGFGRGNILHTNGVFQFFGSDDQSSGFTIDSTFGDSGQVLFQDASDLIELPDGRFAVNVVTGGSRAGTASDLIYFTADGQVDTARGDNGRVPLFGFAGAGVSAFDDGSILVSSTAGPASSTTFLKLDPNGNFDQSFGNDGSIDVATATTPRITLTPDGGFLVAGAVFSVDFRAEDVLRFNSDGQLDTSFGEGGTARFPEVVEFRQVLVADSGDIFVVSDSGFTTTAEIFRLTADGQRDLSFGDSGSIVIGPNADGDTDDTLSSDLQLDSQGRLIVAQNVDDDSLRLVRFNPDGSPDSSFDAPQLSRPISSFSDFEFDIDSDNRVIGPFNEVVPTDAGFDVTRSIFRLNTDGSFDTTFGPGGIAFVSQENSIGFTDVDTEDIQILADGSLLLLNENDLSRFFV